MNCDEDKMQEVRHTIDDSPQEERNNAFVTGAVYPIWSPYDAFDAATLSKMLKEACKETIS